MTSFLSTHLEAFTNEMEMIAFKFKINGNLYEITFGKKRFQ